MMRNILLFTAILLCVFSPAIAGIPQELIDGAEKGDAEAQFKLADFYSERNESVEDIDAAFRWFERSAEGGHAEAQFVIGQWYLRAFNPEKAVRWIMEAARNGHVDATLKLLDLLYPVYSSDEQRVEMLAIVENMAEAGNLRAQKGLADI